MHLTFAEVDSLDESRLREFLERRLPEGPYLDYKADYSNNKLSSAAAWVSGLSNSLGGLLLIGVIEPKRAASVDEQLIGLVGESEVRRSQLENSLRDSIDPRISGLLVQAVRLVSSRVVLAVYVPASIRGPHMCLSDNRIYARHSESTAKMTMHEIRESVLRTGTVLSSARDFISSRMAIAQTQFSAPNLLLQACPLSPWAIDRTLEKVETMTSRFNLSATAANLQHSFNVFDSIQYNVDGLVFQNHDESIRLNVFRDGYIEAFVRSIQFQEINGGQPYFDSQFHWEFIHYFYLCLRDIELADNENLEYLVQASCINATYAPLVVSNGFRRDKIYNSDRHTIVWPQSTLKVSMRIEDALVRFKPQFFQAFGNKLPS